MASSINASTSGAGGLITTADNTGILNLQTAGTTGVTVDASQNVGVGSGLTTLSSKFLIYSPTTSSTTDIVQKWVWNDSTSAATWGLQLDQIHTGSSIDYQFKIKNNSTTPTAAIYIKPNGDVGFNSGYGSAATAYGCRAWVNFNGTGTVAIRASGNVTSITDNGTGDYTVNFTTAITDANYAPVATLKPSSGASSTNGKVINIRYDTNLSTSSCRFWCNSTGGAEDFDVVSVSIFR